MTKNKSSTSEHLSSVLTSTRSIFSIKRLLAVGVAVGLLHSFIFKKDTTVSMEKQIEALAEFKKIILPKIPKDSFVYKFAQDDHYLGRWLRGASYNPANAQEHLENHLRWRKENNIDRIHEENWAQTRGKYPISLNTKAKNGAPICEIPFGQWDILQGIADGEEDRILRLLIFELEMFTRQVYEARASGKKVEASIELVDLAGFSLMKHFSLSFYYNWIVMYINNYYGIFGTSYNINASAVYTVFIKLCEPFVGDKFMKLYGPNDNWMADLDMIIDKNQRSIGFGGTINRSLSTGK